MKKDNNQLQEILTKLNSIERLVSKQKSSDIDDFISEFDAKKLLKRGTTWFWNLRQSGFPYTKLGGQVFYDKKDLIKYFEGNKTNDSRNEIY